MIQDFFTPVSDKVFINIKENSTCLGSLFSTYTEEDDFPDLQGVNIAFFDVREGRGTENNEETAIGADAIRQQLYALEFGNWQVKLVDLGSILAGNTIADTYYAVKETVSFLVKKNIAPIIIGGGIDLVYANYRAYDQLDQMVNLSVVSPKLSFGNVEDDLGVNSYLSKIILEEPNNLFNYSNLGYQTFYNSQEEIALIDSLSFEAHRVGALKDISIAEPVMRDADIVAIDLGVIKACDAPGNANANPNGFYGEDICAIARYAGISDKVTSFGLYEFNALKDQNNRTSKLISQAIWYFIEGYSLRTNDYPFGSKKEYLRYLVPLEEDTVAFYQSNKSLRWWMEIAVDAHNKYNRHVLIPCSYEDYLQATEQKMPERWFLANNKLT